MKKPLAIGGAVLGVLLAAALVIFIFFPGLPTYITAKHKYKDINRTVPDFVREEVPDSFKQHTLRDVAVSLPSDWKAHSAIEGIEPGSYRSTDEDSMILVTKHDRASYDLISSSEYLSDLNVWESYDYSEDDYRHFFDKLGCEYPDLWFYEWMIWLQRDGYTAKDCIRLRGKDLKVFRELAAEKSECFELERSWRFGGEDFYGYIGQLTGMGYDGKLWTCAMVPYGSEDTYYAVSLRCSDEAAARQILSSIHLK